MNSCLWFTSVSSNQDGQSPSTSITDYELAGNDKCEKIVTADLKDDPLAKILWDVEPQTLQCVFLAMAVSFLFTYQPWKCQRSLIFFMHLVL